MLKKNHLLNHFRCQQWHRIRKILIHRNNRSIKPSRGSGNCCISPWWPFFNNVAFAAEVAKLFRTMGSKMSKSFAPETLDNTNVTTSRSSLYAYATGRDANFFCSMALLRLSQTKFWYQSWTLQAMWDQSSAHTNREDGY